MRVLLHKLNTVADEVIPPLSLGYLAASAPGHDIAIQDAQKENLDDQQVVHSLRTMDAQVLGLQVWTKDLPQARRLLRLVKKELPGVVTAIGGVQPSVMPQGTMEFFGESLDYLFHGESEPGFASWLASLEGGGEDLSGVPGLVWKDGSGIHVNPASAPENLDDLPFPRWDLMDPRSYPRAPHGAFLNQFPVAPMITSRGCPFSCTFCSAPVLSGRSIRFRSLDNIFAEIDMLQNEYGVRELHIEDDNFSLKRDFVLEFSERITSRGLTWCFPNGIRLDTLDEEVLAAMRKGGCYALNFGVESGDDETLRRINKKIDTKGIRERLKLVRRFDFHVGGFFIIGFPWETEAHVRRTIDFACDLDLDLAGFSFFQPFPGTELARELEASGEYAIDLEHFDTSLHSISYVPPALTREQLAKLRRMAMRRFYFRPRVAWDILSRVTSPAHFFYILKRGLRWMGVH